MSLQTLKGFRDFLPSVKIKRDLLEQRLMSAFQGAGFLPLETPTLEYADVLLGKYGDEADSLVYTFLDKGERNVGLRYDQTVPTARVLAQYFNEIPKYFRRYQVQNVFRADKPQKGRYREFKQFDIDIFGSNSLIADAEVLAATYAALKNVGFNDFVIYVNDRELLVNALSQFTNDQVDVFSLIQSIDKLDKKTSEEVMAELVAKGLNEEFALAALETISEISPSESLERIMSLTTDLGVPDQNLVFLPFLARGLDYYTGMIFEVKLGDFKTASIAGGGRYDNLIRSLGGPDVPAVGGAIGFDRTYEAADEQGLLEKQDGDKYVVACLDEEFLAFAAKIAAELRSKGKVVEIIPEVTTKLGKLFQYAEKVSGNKMIIIGEAEYAENKVSVKDLVSGEQRLVNISELI